MKRAVNQVLTLLKFYISYSNPLIILTIIFSLTTILFSGHSYWLDLFSHFQLQYQVTLLLISLISIVQCRSLKAPILALIYCIAIFITFGQHDLLEEYDNTVNSEVIFWNTNYFHYDQLDKAKYLSEHQDSIIALTESNEVLVDELVSRGFTNQLSYYDKGYSCAILSQQPPKETQIINEIYPICIASYEDFELIIAHPTPPYTPKSREDQIDYFAQINKLINQYIKDSKNYLLVADLNSTPYSQTYRKYFNFDKSEALSSWHHKSIFQLPLDHAFSNLDIKVTKDVVEYSDHLPLHIEVE